jgi:phosphatidylserine decarboxylase
MGEKGMGSEEMETPGGPGAVDASRRVPDWRGWRDRLLLQEDLNFLLTNRVPRVLLTRLMGRLSRIRSPWFTRCAIRVWRMFTELDLEESAETRFESLRDCFTRALKPGSRPIDVDPAVMVSPCDAIVGECGQVEDGRLYQAKGFPYAIEDLFGSEEAARAYRDGCYVTLRLTSAMYHRFHAPDEGRIRHVTYLSGDAWNVNPIALRRVERLFCRNERAAVHCDGGDGRPFALVAVAAILVASIRIHGLNALLHLKWRGPNEFPCEWPVRRGEELGWFEHGSTIILFAPAGFKLHGSVSRGSRVRMGEALVSKPPESDGSSPAGHPADATNFPGKGTTIST